MSTEDVLQEDFRLGVWVPVRTELLFKYSNFSSGSAVYPISSMFVVPGQLTSFVKASVATVITSTLFYL